MRPCPPAGANVGSNPPSLSGYQLSVVYPWELSYFPYNFSNDTGQGAIFEQLYFRQAFQSLVDQEGVINGPLHGYGKANVGPVSGYPVTRFLAPQLAAKGDQWPLNINGANQDAAAAWLGPAQQRAGYVRAPRQRTQPVRAGRQGRDIADLHPDVYDRDRLDGVGCP